MHNKVNVRYFNRNKFRDVVVVIPHYIENSPDPIDSINKYLPTILKCEPDDIQFWDFTRDSEYSKVSRQLFPNLDITIERQHQLQLELERELPHLDNQIEISNFKKKLDEYIRIRRINRIKIK